MKALYFDDSVTTCDCCGRIELKATVAMQLSNGGILHYGRTCAARNSGKSSKQIRQEVFAEQARKERYAAQLAHRIEAWNAYQADDFGNPHLEVQRRNYHLSGGQAVNGKFPEWLCNRAAS